MSYFVESVDREYWEAFIATDPKKVKSDDVDKIAALHAKYYNHKVKRPCSCNPSEMKKMIIDLNKIYGK